VQGHGVHSAFRDSVDALKKYTRADVTTNNKSSADIVHLHTVGPYALWHLLRPGGLKVVSAHVLPDSFVGSLIGAKYWRGLAAAYLKWFYNHADAVLAVSSDVQDELTRMGVKKPIYFAPNILETNSFHSGELQKQAARAKLGITNEAFVVMGAGQVQPRKSMDVFVSTAESVGEAQFIWVGGVPFKRFAAEAASMEQIMHYPPKNVRFTGQVSRSVLITYLQAADMFFFPSKQETFGIVIVEAAAAGLPLLLRDLEVYEKIFQRGYEKGNDESFATQIRKFINDQDYYRKWKMASRSIASKYDAEIGAANLISIYQKLVETKMYVSATK
jgi:1,2-diacylglycerol-3-alpha-glucose alpha-1,2-galactosyltransferase